MSASTAWCAPAPNLDALDLGVRTGLLWAGANVTIAGLGTSTEVDLGSGNSLATGHEYLDRLRVGDSGCPVAGLVGFAALPFDLAARRQPTKLLVPQAIVVADTNGTWLVGSDIDESTARQLAAEAIREQVSQDPGRVQLEVPVAPEFWRDEVLAPVRDRLVAGELRKVVLARELVLMSDRPIHTPPILRRLIAGHRNATTFAVDGFIGASPEMLIARRDDVVFAHPLAGTAARATGRDADEAAAAALASSSKNRREHQITIDWLLDKLLPFCSFVDADPEPQVITLANVHHLGTRVEGRLSRPVPGVLELVAALHPTPALGGDPQDRALDVIAAVEPGDRGRYGGAVGWVDAEGNGEFAVGIRSGQVNGNELRMWAGVGVVADSDPAAELEETRAKFEAMLGAVVRL